MTKFLKRIFQVLLTLLFIIVITIIGIVNFVNPNQFKGTIEKEVFAKTGLTLTVKGPIQWRWFPMLALEFQDIAIQNLPPFSGQLLAAKAIEVECQLLPALTGKVALTVNLKGLDLALVKNAKGQSNWENLNNQNATPKSTTKDTSSDSPVSITLNSVKIQEGKLSFTDLSQHNEYTLNHVNLAADDLFKGLLAIGAPLDLSFELNAKGKKLAHIFLSTDWMLKKEKEQVNLQKITLKFKLPDGIANVITGDAEIIGFSKAPAIKSHLFGKALEVGQLKIDTFKTTLSAEKNIISTQIEMNNGKLQGIDLVSLLKNAQSSIHGLIDALTHKLSIDSLSVVKSELAKWKTDPQSSAFTPFNSLKTNATLTNGIINNPNLVIDHTDYVINGSGMINVSANKIQYQTTLQLKNNPYPASDKAGNFLFQTPLHIQIQGALDDLKIQPDLSTYMNSALQFTQKELMKKAVQKTIEKVTGNTIGNGAVQDTIHRALGNILNPQK